MGRRKPVKTGVIKDFVNKGIHAGLGAQEIKHPSQVRVEEQTKTPFFFPPSRSVDHLSPFGPVPSATDVTGRWRRLTVGRSSEEQAKHMPESQATPGCTMPDSNANGAAGNGTPKVAATLAPLEPASSFSGSTSASTKVRQRRPSFTETAAAAAESLLHTAEATVEATLHQIGNLLWSWDDLPAWRRDNHFIRSGYRPTSYSVRACLASLGYLHNESVNIWTHLLGSAAFLLGGLLLYALVAPRYASASDSDVLVFACFLGGAFVCLSMSATFHTLSNHSPEVAMWGNKLDYTGIVFLIVGSYVPALYYGFFCHKYLMTFYLATVSLPSSTLSVGQGS